MNRGCSSELERLPLFDLSESKDCKALSDAAVVLINRIKVFAATCTYKVFHVSCSYSSEG